MDLTQRALAAKLRKPHPDICEVEVGDRRGPMTVDTLRRWVRRLQDKTGADRMLLVVDPLQRLYSGNDRVDQNDTQRINYVSNSLLAIAKQLNVRCPVGAKVVVMAI